MKISMSIGPFGAMTLVFVILKLAHFITWSWLLVLSPILFVLSLPLLFFTVIFLIFIVERIIEDWGRLVYSIKKGWSHGD